MKKEEEIDRKQENDETIDFKRLSLGGRFALAACADQEANAEQQMPKAEQKKPEEKTVHIQKKKTIHPHGLKQRNRQSRRF